MLIVYHTPMKRLLILIPFLFLLFACSDASQEYSVALKVNTDKVTVYKELPAPHIETKVNTTINCSYRLIPETDKTINVSSVTSTDEEVIEILDVDSGNKKITARAIKSGESKIHIKTADYGSSTTLVILVNN